MTALSFRPPETAFLGPEAEHCPPAAAGAVVIPYPLEATVTYGTGTSRGPEALIAASQELETFDEEFWCEPNRAYGIATLEKVAVTEPVETALAQIAQLVSTTLDAGQLPLVIGGEHALTAGAIRPHVARVPDLAVLHFDAHADLRDGYRGEPFSHAAAMRRVLDHPGVRLVSVGVRNISAEEAAFLAGAGERITIYWAKDRARWQPDEIATSLAGRPVYVSFDVDAFDASLMPATGTPEPGGLDFDEACAILRAVSCTSPIVGADIVELAPIPGFHAADFTAAKLAYKLMSYALAEPLSGRAA